MRATNKKAQSTLEYAIILAVVVGALIAMQGYIKRAVEGRLRSSTDNIGDQYSAGSTTSKFITTETDSTTVETVGVEGVGITNTAVTNPATTTMTTQGGAAEKVTKDLSEESLFSKEGKLFDD